jgi:hypothetical protein
MERHRPVRIGEGIAEGEAVAAGGRQGLGKKGL